MMASIVISMMQHRLVALKQLVNRVTKEYLPGGKFNMQREDQVYRQETMSAPKHTKLPEHVLATKDFYLVRDQIQVQLPMKHR